MDDETLGSLTKELPLASVDQAISLIADGMRYESFRSLAARRVHKDLPALLAHRFLRVDNGVIIRDRLLSIAESEGIGTPRVRKIMYFAWAFRDHRLRRFITEVVADKRGIWQPQELTRKSNADFFKQFFKRTTAPKVRSNIEYFFVETGIYGPFQ